jgi:hypothetical protein
MDRMHRRGLAWLLAVPLVTVGSLSAHALVYRIVEPEPDARATLLETTGHGYLSATPFLLGTCLAFLVSGLLAVVLRSRRGTATTPASWPLALLAPLGFAAQEHLERLVATGSFPSELPAQPTFLVGLALQLPFALAALLAARWLGRAAEAVGRAIAIPAATPPRPGASAPGAVATVVLPPRPALASGRSVRGPPRSS